MKVYFELDLEECDIQAEDENGITEYENLVLCMHDRMCDLIGDLYRDPALAAKTAVDILNHLKDLMEDIEND